MPDIITNLIRHNNTSFFVKLSFDFLVACRRDITAALILQVIHDSKTEWSLLTADYIKSSLMGYTSERTIRRSIKLLEGYGFIYRSGSKSLPKFKLNADRLSETLIIISESAASFRDPFGGYDTAKMAEHLSAKMASCIGQNADNLENKYIKNKNTNNTNMSVLFTDPKGQEEIPLAEEKKIDEEESMALTEVQSVLRVYHNGGSKFKHDQYKKSVANLTERFGNQIETIIKTYGQDKTTEGIREFLNDDYWQKNGLPIPAFLKSPWKWIPGVDDLNEPQRIAGGGGASRYQKRLSALPAPSNGQETASYESSPAAISIPADRGRLRAMRRNEALMILNSCGSALYSEFGAMELDDMEDSTLEEWFLKACREFRIKTGRDASVSSRPLAMEAV